MASPRPEASASDGLKKLVGGCGPPPNDRRRVSRRRAGASLRFGLPALRRPTLRDFDQQDSGRLPTMTIGFAALLGLIALPQPTAEPPELRREFRGVWVATVANIDWPSKKGLPAADQKKELLAIFDRCVAMKLNAVVLQLRPMCDALCKSDLEPWSE